MSKRKKNFKTPKTKRQRQLIPSIIPDKFGIMNNIDFNNLSDVFIGLRRNKSSNPSLYIFKDIQRSKIKEEVEKFTPLQIMNRDRMRIYPNNYSGVTPSFGLDKSSIENIKDYLKGHVFKDSSWTFFFIPSPDYLQINDSDHEGVEDERLTYTIKDLLKQNPNTFIVRNTSKLPKFQSGFFGPGEDQPDPDDNPFMPSNFTLHQGEDLIIKSKNGFQLSISNHLFTTLMDPNKVYNLFPPHELLNTSVESNHIYYIYFLHLLIKHTLNEKLTPRNAIIFYKIFYKIYYKKDLKNLKTIILNLDNHELLSEISTWENWILQMVAGRRRRSKSKKYRRSKSKKYRRSKSKKYRRS